MLITYGIIFLLADVVIVERLQNLKKVENDSIELCCKVNNPRNYPVEWFKDGKPIVSDERYFFMLGC